MKIYSKEEYAREHDLYCLDRVDYIQHSEWGTVHEGCALPGSEILNG